MRAQPAPRINSIRHAASVASAVIGRCCGAVGVASAPRHGTFRSQPIVLAALATPTSVPFSSRHLDALLAFAASNAAARADAVYLRPGDIVWRLPLERLAALGDVQWLRLWFDARGLAGYVWFEPPTGAELDIRSDLDWRGEVGNALIDWSEAARRELPAAYPWLVDLEDMAQWADRIRHPPAAGDGHWLTMTAHEGDEGRIAALRGRGYAPSRHYAVIYGRDLAAPLTPSRLPAGYGIRNVSTADVAERVAVHRDAWVGSSWTIERYQALRAADAYDEALDLVVEDAAGRFAACCICWADQASRSGHFEPVGTRPEYRGQGLTRELVREGFRHLAKRSMETAHTETPGFNAPARALYESSGFTATGKRPTFIKRLDR